MSQACYCRCPQACGPAVHLWVTQDGALFPLCGPCLAGWQHNAVVVPSLQPRQVRELGATETLAAG